jgi:hypothetical protein
MSEYLAPSHQSNIGVRVKKSFDVFKNGGGGLFAGEESTDLLQIVFLLVPLIDTETESQYSSDLLCTSSRDFNVFAWPSPSFPPGRLESCGRF